MHLFFYGTLTHEHLNPVTALVMPLLGAPHRASAGGQLYVLRHGDGWYPALVPGRGRVHGWVYRCGPAFDRTALALLDRYEDHDPKAPRRSEYLRRQVVVRLRRGGRLRAQAYLWNRPVRSPMAEVSHGDFAAFLAATGLPPLSCDAAGIGSATPKPVPALAFEAVSH